MSITKTQKLKDAIETAAHEVGHALVCLYYGASSVTITMLMTVCYNEESFASSDKCVHGNIKIANISASKMDVAAISYAGLIGMLMYYDEYAELSEDVVYNKITNSPKDWSKDDLEGIACVGNAHQREVFNRAYKILTDNYASLRKYTDTIAENFAELDKEKVEYTLSALHLSTPACKEPGY